MPKIKFGPQPSTEEVTYLDAEGMIEVNSCHVEYKFDKNDASLRLATNEWYFASDLDALIDFLKDARKAVRKANAALKG